MNTAPDNARGRKRFPVAGVASAVILLTAVVVLLLPAIQQPRSGRRSPCTNNLKTLGLALHNYHDTYKSFPPAYVADENGRPLHSWRVLILPFLEDPQAEQLYKEYRHDEPWNGPSNRNLAERMPSAFRCPDSQGGAFETSYVAVVGDETVWPPGGQVSLKAVRDGTSKTILLTEIADSGIHWMEPRDLPFYQAIQGINPPLTKLSASSGHPSHPPPDGANMLFCDGSVHYLTNDVPPEAFRAVLTITGGEENADRALE